MPTPTPNIDPTVYDVPVAALVPYERNPRMSDAHAIAESLRINGQFRPIVVRRETREILGGNHTWQAAQLLGWDTIKVTYVEGITDEQAARIVLADNRFSDLASYSVPDLTALLDSLPNLAGTGYDDYVAVNLDAAFTNTSDPQPATPALQGDDPLRQPRVLTCPNCDHTWEA